MGLHTPIDIGAGALLGTLVLVFYLAVDGTFNRHYFPDSTQLHASFASDAYRIASRQFSLAGVLELKLLACLHATPLLHSIYYSGLLSVCCISHGHA